MSQNDNFLGIPDQKDLFVPVRNGRSAERRSNSPVDEEEEENEDDIRLIPRSSPIPRKRGSSIADETAEYMRIRLALKQRVSFADATGGELVDVREFTAFDSDDEDTERWEAEEARYRAAVREPTYRLTPEFQSLSGDELMRAVRAGKVEVERLSFCPDEPLAFFGTIRVLNISFHKSVYVRSTMDGWGTYFDYLADYVEGSNDGESDLFSFKLSFAPPYLFNGARIDFVVRYETSNGEFWANNSGKNYSVTLYVTFEDPAVKATGIDVHRLRGILKPPTFGVDDDYDSGQEYDDEGASRPEREPESLPSPVQPVIVHPEMDIDVGVREQGSLFTSSTNPLQITTTTVTTTTATAEGTACSSTATELTPTSPATEMSPAAQQDTTTQASTSLPLSEPEPELGSGPDHPLHQQQETQQPVTQEEVDDVTAVPACCGATAALAAGTITEDTFGLMPTSETRDTGPEVMLTTDIPHQLGLPKLASLPLSLDQETEVKREEDTGVASAEEMEEEFEEIDEERVRIESIGDVGVETSMREQADLKTVPQVRPGPLTSSGREAELSRGPGLRSIGESAQAVGEAASCLLPTYQSSVHPGPTGKDGTTQSPPFLSEATSDAAAKSVEQKSFAEELASPQYFTFNAPATARSTRNPHSPDRDRLDACDGTEQPESTAKDSHPTSVSHLTSDVPEDGALRQPGSSAEAPDGALSIRKTLRPAALSLSVVVCLLAALQEPSLFLALGIFLVLHCF